MNVHLLWDCIYFLTGQDVLVLGWQIHGKANRMNLMYVRLNISLAFNGFMFFFFFSHLDCGCDYTGWRESEKCREFLAEITSQQSSHYQHNVTPVYR